MIKSRVLARKEPYIWYLMDYFVVIVRCFLGMEANRTYKDITVIEKVLDEEVALWMADTERMKKLTCWDWIEEQISDTNRCMNLI